jgi:hypothetical protein
MTTQGAILAALMRCRSVSERLREAMRTFLRAAACIVLFAGPAMARDCAAIRAACVDQCQNRAGATGTQPLVTGTLAAQVRACINRCSIAPCQQTPLAARLCDATAQSICNNGFRACNGGCTPSTATTQALLLNQAACTNSCCNKFKQCLMQRQCDISTITAITCD